uniref:Cytochrome P450 n=1 Tax=Araucaria cunninghamii TaxID=56994 RepID=A0A0D6QS82_ARACU
MFSAASLEKWQLVREGEIASVIASIFHLHQLGKPADIAELAHAFTLNIIGQMVFHTRIGDKQEAFQFKRDVDHFLQLFGGFRIGDFVPFLSWTNLGGSRAEMHQVLRLIDDYFVKKLQELEQNNHKEKALIQVLQAQAEEGRINDVNVNGIVLDMLLTGTDTASKTIEWAMTELIRHPEVMQRLQEEIDGVVGEQEMTVRESHLGRMKYLKAVLKETLRLHPPTPLMLPHAVPPEGCCPVLGYTIPKGSRVVVNVWAVGRDPLRWKDPLKFDPARFMEDPIDVLHAQDFGVIPFGAGRRMCPGRNLGFRMVELAIASLVHAFQWSLPMGENPKDLDMSEVFGLSVSKAVSLQVLATPRLLPHLYPYNYGYLFADEK